MPLLPAPACRRQRGSVGDSASDTYIPLDECYSGAGTTRPRVTRCPQSADASPQVATPTLKLPAPDKLSPGGQRDDMPPVDGSSTRGRSTSVRGRVRSPLMAKLQATSVPIA